MTYYFVQLVSPLKNSKPKLFSQDTIGIALPSVGALLQLFEPLLNVSTLWIGKLSQFQICVPNLKIFLPVRPISQIVINL